MNVKKKRVIEAALTLFIEKGFAQTSIRDIIQEAEISKGTFYNYFNSKNECLIAILAYVNEQGDQQRRELAEGKDKRDESVFVRQLGVRMNLNKERNLFPLFESVMFSDDPELIAYMKKQHILEMQWVAKRITEIYTPGVSDYALDQATILFGIIHHFIHVWKIGTDKDFQLEKLIQFALNRLKPVIEDQLSKKEAFFPQGWLHNAVENNSLSDLRSVLQSQLEKLIERTDNSAGEHEKITEYLHFLLQEITEEEPRTHLLESITMSLSKSVRDEQYQSEIRELSQNVWSLTRALKGEQAGK